MGHKDLGTRNYNPTLAAQATKEGKAYLKPILAMEPYERLLYWIMERHKVHTTRFPSKTVFDMFMNGETYGQTLPPWTQDPILQTLFFCNPYRENDKVTAYLREWFREPQKDNPAVFIGTILLRWYNYIPTMQRLIQHDAIGKLLVGATKSEQYLQKLTDILLEIRYADGGKEGQLFGGAYIIRPIVDGDKGARKVESIHDLMLSMIQTKTLYKELLGEADPGIVIPTARQFASLGSTTGDHNEAGSPGTMAYAFARLQSFSGMGKFYCYQFIGDLAYTHVLRGAKDWFTWGFCGPGTSRGLVRLKCPTGKATLPSGKRLPRLMPLQRGWQEQLLALQERVNLDIYKLTNPKGKAPSRSAPKIGKAGGEVRTLQPLHMRDLCNCLCEYDKYERALFNERSLKRPYAGT